MRKGAKRYGRDPLAFSANLMNTLTEHTWPGNLREMENVINRYLVLGDEKAILDELRPSASQQSGAQTTQGSTERRRFEGDGAQSEG